MSALSSSPQCSGAGISRQTEKRDERLLNERGEMGEAVATIKVGEEGGGGGEGKQPRQQRDGLW